MLSTAIIGEYLFTNKKVLLCECKRHTARKRAQDGDPPLAALTFDLTPPAGLTFDLTPPRLD